jgi:hypothetical protein
MYEPYPTSGPEPAPEPIQPPRSVHNAVNLMYLGAALELVALIVALLSRGSMKAAILSKHPFYTATQLHRAEMARTVILVVGALVGVALWLWMAWANGRGHNWARVVSAVFFGIATLDLLLSFTQVLGVADRIVGVAVWLVGLAAIVLIFNRESAPFYARPAAPG